VELAINGRVVSVDTPPSGNLVDFSIARSWMPTAEGAAPEATLAPTEEPTEPPTEEPTEEPTEGPDLTISHLVVTPPSGHHPLPASVDVRVLNAGDEPSGEFLVEWQAPGGECVWAVAGLDPGQEVAMDCKAAITGLGALPTVATVDSGEQVDEVNEGNNTRVFVVTALAQP